MIWWLALEIKPFQFWREIWIQVVVILLQLNSFFIWLQLIFDQKPCFLGPIKLLIHDLTDIRLCVCNCRSVHKVTHLGVLSQVKCWKKKLKITSSHSRHFTIGCSWFPDRLRKGLLTNILFNFPNVITEFGTFAKTSTRKNGTKIFYLEKDASFIKAR